MKKKKNTEEKRYCRRKNILNNANNEEKVQDDPSFDTGTYNLVHKLVMIQKESIRDSITFLKQMEWGCLSQKTEKL